MQVAGGRVFLVIHVLMLELQLLLLFLLLLLVVLSSQSILSYLHLSTCYCCCGQFTGGHRCVDGTRRRGDGGGGGSRVVGTSYDLSLLAWKAGSSSVRAKPRRATLRRSLRNAAVLLSLCHGCSTAVSDGGAF